MSVDDLIKQLESCCKVHKVNPKEIEVKFNNMDISFVMNFREDSINLLDKDTGLSYL